MPEQKNNSQEYWNRRARQDKIKVIKTSEQGVDNLKKLLKKNIDSVEKQITEFYKKYGDEGKYAEQLSYAEFQKYKAKLRLKARQNPQDKTLQRLAKQDIPKYRIDRLRALQTDLQIQLTEATRGQEAGIYKTLKDVAKVSQATTALRFKKTLDVAFDKIASRKLEKILSSDWVGDMNWSERLWKDREVVGKKVTEILETGLPQGKSMQDMARDLKDATQSSFNDAFRLIRTESAHVDGEVLLESFKQAKAELGYTKYIFDATIDNRTSKICADEDNKSYLIDEAVIGKNFPPLHPNCRSTAVLDESSIDESVIENSKQEEKEEETQEEKYNSFKNGEEANKFFYNNKEYKEWKKNLTQDKTEAIQEYTGDLYSVVNDKLRGFYDTDDKMIKDAINQLSNSISDFELKNNIQVYRSVDAIALDKFMSENKINNYIDAIGKTYNDKAFMSTSLLRDLEDFKEKDIQFVINVPKGKGRGAYINDLSLKKDYEYEFLLQKNSKLNITDVKTIDNTNKTIIYANLETS